MGKKSERRERRTAAAKARDAAKLEAAKAQLVQEQPARRRLSPAHQALLALALMGLPHPHR